MELYQLFLVRADVFDRPWRDRWEEDTMLKFGEPPYLECSSRGDKRFSAFYAKIDGKTIEEQYQAFKIFEGGITGLNWRKAKGKTAINQKECALYYDSLWRRYIDAHPELQTVLEAATGLSDVFGQVGHVCQAEVLWRIKHAYAQKKED